MHVHLGDPEHREQRNYETANIQPPLARLAKNNKDEDCVDEVIGSGHGTIMFRSHRPVVGARVEPRVQTHLNPRVDPRPTPRDRGPAQPAVLLDAVLSTLWSELLLERFWPACGASRHHIPTGPKMRAARKAGRSGAGELRTCPDSWQQPSGGPARLRASLGGLAELPVEHVLVSHGPAVLGNGLVSLRAAIR
jgi:hypothetical protein